MKIKCLPLMLLLCTVSLTTSATGQDFSRTMQQVLGRDYPRFQWLNYPVNNYGIGTSYRGKKNKPDIGRFLCGTLNCLGVGNPPNIDSWMKPNDFVEVGCGEALDAKVQQSKKLILSALLPKIAGILGLKGNLQKELESTAEITKLSICDRRLQQERMTTYITGLRDDKYGLQKYYNADELILVVGDVVIKEMVVKITAKPSLKASLDATLQGNLEKALGDKASFNLSLEKKGETNYSFTVNQPVVAGILAVRKGPGRGISETEKPDLVSPWKGWVTTSVQLPK